MTDILAFFAWKDLSWHQVTIGFIVTFLTVFFKIWQQKNVVGSHYKMAFVTSYLINLSDVIFIGLVATGGWTMFLPCSTGGALGVMCAMYYHDKFVKSRDDINSQYIHE